MDYAVDYIKSNFKSPEELVIATNYEEYVYMYYLGSRVTVGYVGNNLEEDRRVQPDIIIPRRGRPNNIEVLAELLNKEEYELVTLPIFDYFYNNIPELGSHLYKTKLTENPEDRLRLYIRKELYEKIN